MSYQPMEELLPKANFSVYRLVRMASNRALELSEGKRCLIENPSSEKVTTRALEEIAQGKVTCKEVADQFPPEEPVESEQAVEKEVV